MSCPAKLSEVDPEMARLIEREQQRQSDTLELIASENHASRAVLEAMGTVLTDKYAEGYPGRRWYQGCRHIDDVERLAIARAKEVFGAEHANVQPHSGTSANLAVYLAALEPGQKIMGMSLSHGGHLSHGYSINISGSVYRAVNYGVRRDTEMLDLDQIRRMALEERPDMLVVGASAYPRSIDFAAFGEIAREASCLLLADIAHIAGLVVGGVHPDPVPHSEFVTTTAHKTLRGPRGGIILCRGQWAEKIDAAIFPGIQGGPLEHVIAAKAVALHEATRPEFRKYAARIVSNARFLADELLARGWRLVAGGTDNHLLLIDLRSRHENLTGATAAAWLESAGIIANKNTIPFETRSAFEASGIRLGTPALTTRGMGTDEMKQIAVWVDRVLNSDGEAGAIADVAAGVAEMCRRFPIPNNSN
jgi:glycine hydroxymethyltransferase